MVAILHADVEAWLIGFYQDTLAARPEPYASDVWVGNHMTASTGRRLLVRDDGGPVLGDVRAVARVGLQVWADTAEESFDLANLASALLAGAADGNPVVRVDVTRPYSVPDPGHKHYFTGELLIRGTEL